MFEFEDRYWWFVGRRYAALHLLKHFWKGDEKPRVLDLGCGTGVVSCALNEFAETTGLDFSDHALKFSATRGLSHLVRGDATHLPMHEGQFDAIVALDVFEHIEDDNAAFRESFRVLRNDGVLVLSVPAYRLLWGPHDIALHHFRRYTKAQVIGRLAMAGFDIECASYSVFFLFPFVLVSRVLEKLRPGPAHASLPKVPAWLNRFLIRLQIFEATLISNFGLKLPWGSSVLVVARKKPQS